MCSSDLELLRDVLRMELPAHEEARIESAELSEVVPTEYRADMVLVLRRAEAPVMALVLEAQLRPDPQKRLSWPSYLVNLRSRLGVPVCLLVLTPSERVARWAARPIELGHPGFTLRPIVLGPSSLPKIRDPDRAKAAPEQAVLSVMAHGRSDPELAVEVAMAAIGAVTGFTEETAVLYFDLIMASLGEAAKKAVRAMVQPAGYEYQSDFAKEYFGKGLQKGLETGIEQGRQEGQVLALLRVLEARGLAPSAEQRAAIEAADAGQLDAWLGRVAEVSSVEELIGGR